MKLISIAQLVATVLLAAACTSFRSPEGRGAKQEPRLYFGGDIITMESSKAPRYVEAVVTRMGKIAFVGSKSITSGSE